MRTSIVTTVVFGSLMTLSVSTPSAVQSHNSETAISTVVADGGVPNHPKLADGGVSASVASLCAQHGSMPGTNLVA